MKKILITCAMEKEAIDLKQALQLEQGQKENWFQNKEKTIQLILTGIGKQRTAITLTEYLTLQKQPDIIVNVGYAGSTDLPIGEWVIINKSYNYEWDIPGEERYSMLDIGNQELMVLKESKLKQVPCYSAEAFVTKTDLTGSIAFDMELHSIALICDKQQIPLLSLKKISDHLSLDKYYESVSQKEVMELTSCLAFLEEIKQ